MIQKTIQDFLKDYNIPTVAGFIVAVSGGADSITLLHALKALNLKLLALHCNFNLRGNESDTDEQFVKRFCAAYDIPLEVKHFDTVNYASEKSISIEMAARELRYTWFHEIKQQKEMDYIVVGHQADDVAETLFINLCRGTGIKGLSGIKPVKGDVLRPLLSCSRQDIIHYIKDHQLDYREDSSNDSLDFMRNIIRHKIIPTCKEINPSFLNTIRENCKTLNETESIYLYGIAQLQKKILLQTGEETLIHIAHTLNSPAPYTLLFETLYPYGFNKRQIYDILNSHQAFSGKKFLSKKYILTRDRDYWRIYKQGEPTQFISHIENEGNFQLGNQQLHIELLPRNNLMEIPTDRHIICLDAEKIKFPLQIRKWEKGDKFCPFGMHGMKKKLSDFFNDHKFSAKQKEDCLLLLSEEKIVWVIGYRPDERFKITPQTQKVVRIALTEKKEAEASF